MGDSCIHIAIVIYSSGYFYSGDTLMYGSCTTMQGTSVGRKWELWVSCSSYTIDLVTKGRIFRNPLFVTGKMEGFICRHARDTGEAGEKPLSKGSANPP
jgi:hypothetical protein